MAHVCVNLDSYSSYRDSRSSLSYTDQQAQLSRSSTVYVGNLSFFTTEEQIAQLFGMAGPIKRIIMGLDRNTKTPCGFCFVECVLWLALHPRADGLIGADSLSRIMRLLRCDTSPVPSSTSASSVQTSIRAT